MPIQWTAEHIYSLILDDNSRRSSRRMASPEKWLSLGAKSDLIWGEFPVKNRLPFRPNVCLTDLTCACSCHSKRVPCDHILSLLLMWVESPEAFSVSSIPEFAQPEPLTVDTTDQPPAPQNGDARYTSILRGLEELELWLGDLVRNGLADAPHRPKTSWARAAERLIDAGVGELAREVRRIPDIVASGADWTERLLGHIGLLYLLIQGFERLDSLPPDSQADLRMAVGWLPRLDTSNPVRDRWHVLSSQITQEGRQSIQRTWLWGADHNRPALIVQRSYNLVTVDTRLVTGTMLDTDLCYFSGSTPIQAQIHTLHDHIQPTTPPAGYPSIEQAIAAYSQSVSRNPFSGSFPMLLNSVCLVSQVANWFVTDPSGSLPLTSDDSHLWHLSALTRHADAPLFAEWDGARLRPLSVWANTRWVELRTLQGTKSAR